MKSKKPVVPTAPHSPDEPTATILADEVEFAVFCMGHAGQIFVRHQVAQSKWDSVALAELSHTARVAWIRRWFAEGRLPVILAAEPVRECEQCSSEATHQVQARPDLPWVYMCTEHAEIIEENQREVYDHEMRNFNGAYGLPTVVVRKL